MKTKHLIAPAIALAIAGGLVGAQRRAISQLENESVLLRKHIAAEKDRIESQQAHVKPARPAKPEGKDDNIDWLEIAGKFGGMENGGGRGDMREMMSFMKRLRRMDKDQLLAALDQIEALELADDKRMMLEAMLIGPLAEKDPEFVLNRYSDRIGDKRYGSQLADAFGKWAKKDGPSATAWLDREIAAGTFESKALDGEGKIRFKFEMNLIPQLISSDPSAAGARIAALPANQRKQALEGYSEDYSVKVEDQAAHANLVRTHLSEEERYKVFGQYASIMGSLEEGGAYLDRIGATGQERIIAAEAAARGEISSSSYQSKVTEGMIDSMREWLGTQAPGSVDRVTGETLAQAAHFTRATRFENAAAMVLKYHDKGAGDDILTGFIADSRYLKNNDELLKIAGKISDPEKRKETLDSLKKPAP